MRNSKKKPVVPVNPKRGLSKLKRGKGLLAMKGIEQHKWAQKFDPLFKVKGKVRHARVQRLK